ncbi:hypothetical protein NKI01_15885 [Mesorhizobium sp. M0815]|uniref:hypothetical protein n=1 Tax=Mesorhizobium sp. M0815 TaxID=2957005 RepID=UPI00333ADA42
MRYVVDTNVPIVANGRDTNASAECRLFSIDFLENLMAKGHLILDVGGEVEQEYSRHLSIGQPGVGNRFIQAFLTTAVKRVERIEITKAKDGSYDDFPSSKALRTFDLSDRKFAALSKKSGAPVANAVDSDWLEHKEGLEKCGVKIHFICGTDKTKWTKPK